MGYGCKMRHKTIMVSLIAIICLASGVTYSWFTARETGENRLDMGTVEVEVVEDFQSVTDAVRNVEYKKTVQVQSNGTKNTYVRVKLFPEWSEPSLPVSNVQFNLADNSDWVLHGDGYFYFKYYLTQEQVTSELLQSVTLSDLGPEYSGKTLSVKVLVEGVQITHDAWKEVWGLDTLPFVANQPYVPSP